MVESTLSSRWTRTLTVLLVFIAAMLTKEALAFVPHVIARGIGLYWFSIRQLPGLSTAVVLLVAAVIMTRPWDKARLGLIPGRQNTQQMLAMIVGGLALHMAVNTLKQYVTPVDDEFMTNFRLFQRSWDTREGTDLILPLLSVGLLSSVAQEIFFRGYMQTQLREVWGRIGALAIASLCFGLAHLGVADLLHYGFLDVGWLIPVGVAFIASLYYGWIRDITGSVVAAAACHVTWNASVVIRPFERLHRSFSSELWWLVFCLAVFIGCMWYLADELPLGGEPGEATEGLAR